jgi:hypothetical protein
MAKGQMHGNREAKKPKQPKKLPSPVAGALSAPTSKTGSSSAPAKKK